ncbi:MAG: DUF5063 domain-containing protein [Bacteroidales bacterium]|nr:DUF5063 domain-containing protein [Bacteroidales bacterium]
MTDQKLSPNIISFIALANEYCQMLENAESATRKELLAEVLKILPRIYIIAGDLVECQYYPEHEIGAYLTEPVYDQVRDVLCRILGEEDCYLEVFVEEMKYSDVPIACNISENLADLYQVFYNYVASVKDVPTEVQIELTGICKSDFHLYWGQTLCNVLRAVHTAYYTPYNDEPHMKYNIE